MTLEIKWKVTKLECAPETELGPNYVVTAHWECTGVDGIFKGRFFSSTKFDVDPTQPQFVPFENLTEETVLSWIWSADTDKQTIENIVRDTIETQQKPTIVEVPLPWITSVA